MKRTYKIIKYNYAEAFPQLCSYQQWVYRLHRLSPIIGSLFEAAQWSATMKLYLIDSKPIPVCKPVRHGRVRLLRDDGAYFGKTHVGWFFGFKLHVLRNSAGFIVDAILRPGNCDDRGPASEFAGVVDGGIVLGDLGYSGPHLRGIVAEESGAAMIRRADAPEKKRLLNSVRQPVETTFSQLWRGFIDRVFSRSWQGLWNTMRLKMLGYNLGLSGIVSA